MNYRFIYLDHHTETMGLLLYDDMNEFIVIMTLKSNLSRFIDDIKETSKILGLEKSLKIYSEYENYVYEFNFYKKKLCKGD